jgi:predicted PurR-regulated permease PerM
MSTQNEERRPYGRVFARVVLTAVFTAVQLWAVVVLLTQVHVGGVAAVALAAVMAAAVLAVIYGWQEVRTLSRRQTGDDELTQRVRMARENTRFLDDFYPNEHRRQRGRDERDQIAV